MDRGRPKACVDSSEGQLERYVGWLGRGGGVWFGFFFQAEDGIRDLTVTGVQTCALPILAGLALRTVERRRPTLGFSMEHEPNGRFVVSKVDSESSAAQAGLRAGDAIVNWKDRKSVV